MPTIEKECPPSKGLVVAVLYVDFEAKDYESDLSRKGEVVGEMQ